MLDLLEKLDVTWQPSQFSVVKFGNVLDAAVYRFAATGSVKSMLPVLNAWNEWIAWT